MPPCLWRLQPGYRGADDASSLPAWPDTVSVRAGGIVVVRPAHAAACCQHAASLHLVIRVVCAAEALEGVSGTPRRVDGGAKQVGVPSALLAQVADQPRHLHQQLAEPGPCRLTGSQML